MSEFQFKNVLSNDNNIFYDISRHTDYFVTHSIKDAINLAEYVRTIARYFVQNMNKELSKTFQFEKDILDGAEIGLKANEIDMENPTGTYLLIEIDTSEVDQTRRLAIKDSQRWITSFPL